MKLYFKNNFSTMNIKTKIMKKLSLILSVFAILLVFNFSVRGNNFEIKNIVHFEILKIQQTSLVGIYKIDPESLLEKDITDEQKAMIDMLAESLTIDLMDDNKAQASAMGNLVTGSYVVEDDEVAITLDGDTEKFKIKDGKLIGYIDGMKLVFIKK